MIVPLLPHRALDRATLARQLLLERSTLEELEVEAARFLAFAAGEADDTRLSLTRFGESSRGEASLTP